MAKLDIGRMRQAMAANGMKQRDLAKAAGISEVTMSRYMNGFRGPKWGTLMKIAGVLNTTPVYLTGLESTEKPEEKYLDVKVAILEHGREWTAAQKKLLINELLEAM